MLSEEEKALKYFYNLRATIDESYMLFDEEINVKCGKDMIKQITLVLKLITKMQKENEELKATVNKQSIDISNNLLELQQKDKQIDLMAEYIDEIDVSEVICGEKIICDENCKDCIKQYFETKAKKGE